MNKEAEFDQLVGLIYQAALDEDCWQSVLLDLSDFFNAAGTALWVHDFETGISNGESIQTVRFDPEFVISYAEYYSQTNIWAKQEALLTKNLFVTSSMLFDDKLLPSTEYYGDWLKPQNLFYSIGSVTAKTGSLAVKLSALRGKHKGPFTREELAWAQRLFPHLKRACDMNRRLTAERLVTANQLSFSHLAQNASGLCMLGLSATGKVLHANRFGEAMLREGHYLSLQSGCLHVVQADKDSELQQALRNTVALKRAHHLNLGGSNGKSHCFYLTLIPAPESHPMHLLVHRVEVLLLITEQARQRVATVRQLIDLFGLTPARGPLCQGLGARRRYRLLRSGGRVEKNDNQDAITIRHDQNRRQKAAGFGSLDLFDTCGAQDLNSNKFVRLLPQSSLAH